MMKLEVNTSSEVVIILAHSFILQRPNRPGRREKDSFWWVQR